MAVEMRRDPARSRTLAERYCQQQRAKMFQRMVVEIDHAAARKDLSATAPASERFACLLQSERAAR